jgi:hypothetical protein
MQRQRIPLTFATDLVVGASIIPRADARGDVKAESRIEAARGKVNPAE